MIHRRSFLLSTAALAAYGTTGQAQAPMPGMSDSPAGMGAMNGGLQAKPSGLDLPQGEPLRSLSRLHSASTQPGSFVATITAAPTTIEFIPGLRTEVLAYNGSVPGPLIEVSEGDNVSLHFANRVPGQDSTIHWHGLPAPPDQDGNPMHPVASGSDRTYAFKLPEDSAGSFWYHPHPDKHTPEQVFRGLAGAFIVKPKVNLLPDLDDTILFITDLRLDGEGVILPNTESDWANGREGDHILVNRQKRPVLNVSPGASHRFRFYNACNARYLRLAFEGHTMALIGTDGGLISEAVKGLTEILLAPAERAEVVVEFGPSAGRLSLRTLPYDRGSMMGAKLSAVDTPIMSIEIAGPVVAPILLPSKLRDIASLGTPVARKRITFGEQMQMQANGAMSFEGRIDGKPFELFRVDLVSQVGETELWEVSNPTDMDHPLHLHGTQFQVVERERYGSASPEPILAWKDTVNVARGEIVRFLARQDMPGLRVYHCHILEHEERGMMGTLSVQ